MLAQLVTNSPQSTAKSNLFSLVERIDPDMVGAIGLVGTILIFTFCIVAVVTIARTYKQVALSKARNRLINDLIAQGYAVEEIERLVSRNKDSCLTRFFDNREQAYVSKRPAPPVKTGSL